MSELVGRTLANRYHLLARLGEGGMSEVYLARDLERGCLVAIKVMTVPVLGDAKALRERFRREAEALKQLQHPHIVRLYDLVEDARPSFLVMDYIAGQSLDRFLEERQGGSLSLGKAAHILYQIGGALHFAHQQGILHRDIKPSNILLDRGGKAYLTDFGIALLTDRTRLTSGQFVGTRNAYVAPERWLGQAVDDRTDVYALGVLLYELLTGRLPFAATDLFALMRQILEDPPTPPSQWNSDVSSEVEEIVLKALAKAKDDRYPSVAVMLGALQAVAGGEEEPIVLSPEEPFFADEPPLPEPSPSPLSEPRPLRRTFRRPLLLSVGVSLVLLAILGGLTLFGPEGWGLSKTPGATPAVLFTSPTSPTATPTATATPTSPPSSPSSTSTLTPTPSCTCTPTATSTGIPTSTPSPTPYLVVSAEWLYVYVGAGENYGLRGELRRGDQLPLKGRSEDGAWWQVDFFGQEGWIRAQPVGASVDPFALPVFETPDLPTVTPTETPTPIPTKVVIPKLQNPGFEGISDNFIPGWSWWAVDNFAGGDYDPNTSFDTPLFKQADDPARFIHGATLQVDAAGFLKFKAHVFQAVTVSPGATVHFRALASAYSDAGDIKMVAGIDPNGSPGCGSARWGDLVTINQEDGVVQLVAPQAVVGDAGRVTVCLCAEALHATAHNAAFFDSAELFVQSE
jgi:serine/threonine protein kinase